MRNGPGGEPDKAHNGTDRENGTRTLFFKSAPKM